ncbi:site-2 protease family protein [Meiothermus sp.]|uniref:site-2 protease family protein n=1 Tax=Meiothermus sp. TaxID=1955249 RepID=UPI00307D6E8C
MGQKFFRVSGKVYAALAELVSQQTPMEREATISALSKHFAQADAVVLADQLLELVAQRKSNGIPSLIWAGIKSGFIKFPIWRPSEAFTKAIEGRVLKPILASILWMLATLAVLGFFKGIPSLPNLTQFSWQEALLLWLALTLTTAWHELGHVSVAAHFGVRTRSVGIGLFYLQPVGYADVTESWIKPARVRATIALGGILFQTIPLLAAAAAWIVTQHHFLGAYTLASLIGIALNLVPFVRLDGYWLLCHLLDQQNLRQRSLAHLRYLLTRRGQPQFVGAASGLAGVFAVLSVVFASGLYLSVLVYIATALLV